MNTLPPGNCWQVKVPIVVPPPPTRSLHAFKASCKLGSVVVQNGNDWTPSTNVSPDSWHSSSLLNGVVVIVVVPVEVSVVVPEVVWDVVCELVGVKVIELVTVVVCDVVGVVMRHELKSPPLANESTAF